MRSVIYFKNLGIVIPARTVGDDVVPDVNIACPGYLDHIGSAGIIGPVHDKTVNADVFSTVIHHQAVAGLHNGGLVPVLGYYIDHAGKNVAQVQGRINTVQCYDRVPARHLVQGKGDCTPGLALRSVPG